MFCFDILHRYDKPIGTGGYDDFTLQKLRRYCLHPLVTATLCCKSRLIRSSSNDISSFQPGFFTRFSLPITPATSAQSPPPRPVRSQRLCRFIANISFD